MQNIPYLYPSIGFSRLIEKETIYRVIWLQGHNPFAVEQATLQERRPQSDSRRCPRHRTCRTSTDELDSGWPSGSVRGSAGDCTVSTCTTTTAAVFALTTPGHTCCSDPVMIVFVLNVFYVSLHWRVSRAWLRVVRSSVGGIRWRVRNFARRRIRFSHEVLFSDLRRRCVCSVPLIVNVISCSSSNESDWMYYMRE